MKDIRLSIRYIIESYFIDNNVICLIINYTNFFLWVFMLSRLNNYLLYKRLIMHAIYIYKIDTLKGCKLIVTVHFQLHSSCLYLYRSVTRQNLSLMQQDTYW